MNELDFELNTKAIGDDGTIEGLAVGYGNVDHGGDQVMPGAISASLAGRKSLPMLLYHDQKRPAGVWNHWQETSDGLLVKGRFAMSSPTGKEAYGLTKDGAIGGLSMGFKTLKQRLEGKTRQLIEASLHEISLVTIPMNDRTRVLSVKDIVGSGGLPSLPEFENALREAMGFSKTQAAAIAGKGLSQLLRGEPGSEPDADFWSALGAQIRA
tara:strand:+ start:4728 stop:5360 length:633 start_codon:yes stop_codon:yes gene_type:complete